MVEQTCTNLPYGDGETCSATPDEELCAGLERDSTAGLDNAVYRSYASAFGRWATPDPYDGSYDWTDPQSMNRYAYVNGKPLQDVDPTGLYFYQLPNGDVFDNAWEMVPSSFSWLTLASEVAPVLTFGEAIYELGKDFGLWGRKPQFKGNVKASQNGKCTKSKQ